MKRIFYTVISVLLISSMLLLSGCNEKAGLLAYESVKDNADISNTVISNENYSMHWDSKKKTVYLQDNSTGNVWSPIPEDVLNNNQIETGIANNPQTLSPIIVYYYDTENYSENKAISATSAIKNGNVNVTKSDNGFSVIYDFKSENFTVTVDYLLNDDGMSIEIDPAKITEKSDRIVTSVAVAPYFCSVKNGAENSYVFVPSGSGALINSEVVSSTPLETADAVYGTDLSIYTRYEFTNKKSVRMPVYGSVSGNKGTFAIIEDGAANSSICTVSSDNRIGYTAVYASFAVRGYETVDIPKGVKLTTTTARVYSEPLSTQKFSIKFIPIQGEGISYYDMADIYRSYLLSKYEISKQTAEQSVVLKLLGGVMTTEFNFGIPKQVLYPLTTVEDASDIIEDINNRYENKVRFILDGYGSTGLEAGEIAGGYEINSRLGSNKQLKNLFKSSKANGIDITMNFDVIRFNDSSSGFSISNDAAVAATKKRVINNYLLLTTRQKSESLGKYYLLSRFEISNAVEKLTQYLNKLSLNSVTLETLSNTLYSDYNDEKYYAKGNEEEIYDILKSLNTSKIAFVSSDANIYAAVCSDYIYNAPMYSSNYDSFITDVPFYQIVFKGIIPMYSSNWSSAADERELFLKAIETGMGLSLSVVNDYSDTVFSSQQKAMYATNIENALEHIEKLSEEEFFDYYSSVKDAKIINHILIQNDIRKTIFDNGVEVYVNYSDAEYVIEDKHIPANGYLIAGR